MTRTSLQPIRDAAVLLVLIVLAATVRITPPEEGPQPLLVPEVQAASAMPAFLSGGGSTPDPRTVSAPTGPEFDLDLDVDGLRWVVIGDDVRVLPAGVEQGLRTIRVRTPDGDVVCPTFAFETEMVTESATESTATPGEVSDTERTRVLRVTTHRTRHQDKGCST